MKFTHVSFVEEMIVNPKIYEEFRGFRFYRIEYKNYYESDYSLYEKSILLPADFDVQKLEEDINASISAGRRMNALKR